MEILPLKRRKFLQVKGQIIWSLTWHQLHKPQLLTLTHLASVPQSPALDNYSPGSGSAALSSAEPRWPYAWDTPGRPLARWGLAPLGWGQIGGHQNQGTICGPWEAGAPAQEVAGRCMDWGTEIKTSWCVSYHWRQHLAGQDIFKSTFVCHRM